MKVTTIAGIILLISLASGMSLHNRPVNSPAQHRVPISKARLAFIVDRSVYLQSYTSYPNYAQSYSFIISLASFVGEFAKIYPPKVLGEYTIDNRTGTVQPRQHLKQPRQYYQIWCDYIFELVSLDSIVQVRDQVIVLATVAHQYRAYLTQTGYFFLKGTIPAHEGVKSFIARDILGVRWQELPQQKQRKIGIINISPSTLNKDPTEPKIDIDGIFAGIYYARGDKWQAFNILVPGNMPSTQTLTQLDVIFISGSILSVIDKHPNIQQFGQHLMKALRINKALKVIASCFGSQLISLLHGSKVVKGNFIQGLFPVNLIHQNVTRIDYLHKLSVISSLKVFQSHEDCAVTIPSGFIRIASSSSCYNQMLVSEDKRILTFQFHPEYTDEYLLNERKRVSNFRKGLGVGLKKSYSFVDKKFKQSLSLIREVIRTFMDYNLRRN